MSNGSGTASSLWLQLFFYPESARVNRVSLDLCPLHVFTCSGLCVQHTSSQVFLAKYDLLAPPKQTLQPLQPLQLIDITGPPLLTLNPWPAARLRTAQNFLERVYQLSIKDSPLSSAPHSSRVLANPKLWQPLAAQSGAKGANGSHARSTSVEDRDLEEALLPNGGDDEDESEEESEPPSKRAIAVRATTLLVLGTLLIGLFSDPLVSFAFDVGRCRPLIRWQY
jgi:hypothetical protein